MLTLSMLTLFKTIDDLALLSDTIAKAQALLHDLEAAASTVGLHVNVSKTEFMLVNIEDPDPVISSLGLPSSRYKTSNTSGPTSPTAKKDSKIPSAAKLKFFKAFQKRLDGSYTRLLMRAQNLSWKKHPTKKEIYGNLPPISTVVAQRRARFAGHCMRAQDQLISKVLPLRLRQTSRGRRPLTYTDIVTRDVQLPVEEMRVAMLDRAVWRLHVHGVSMDAID